VFKRLTEGFLNNHFKKEEHPLMAGMGANIGMKPNTRRHFSKCIHAMASLQRFKDS